MASPQNVDNISSVNEKLLAEVPTRRPGNVRYIIYYLRHKPLGTIGVSICTIMILTAIFANLIAPHTYQEQNYMALKQSPSLEYLFGTDNYGSCLLYTSASPRDLSTSRMPSSA